MLKEIFEQPEAIAETIGDRVRHGTLVLEGLGMDDDEIRDLRRIVLLACGTAYHACVVGRYVIEEWARVPVEFDIASEWVYRNPVINEHDLVIGITQSGETRDTIEALKLAREKGARTVAITNMMGSQVTREVDSVLYTRAGLEMGVAASKTFTAQVALLYLVALKLAQIRETLPAGEIEFILDYVYKLPRKVQSFLEADHPIEEIARRYHDAHFFLYLGRHIGLPVALEGALKLKEISYIPTEAYSAGEMKHGPIALLDEQTPVVVVATNIHVYDKIVSNIQEVRARGAHVIAIATDGNEDIQHHADDVIYVPKTPAFLQVVLAILPAAAPRVPDRASPRPERRPAAEPREDRHGRVARRSARRPVYGIVKVALLASGASPTNRRYGHAQDPDSTALTRTCDRMRGASRRAWRHGLCDRAAGASEQRRDAAAAQQRRDDEQAGGERRHVHEGSERDASSCRLRRGQAAAAGPPGPVGPAGPPGVSAVERARGDIGCPTRRAGRTMQHRPCADGETAARWWRPAESARCRRSRCSSRFPDNDNIVRGRARVKSTRRARPGRSRSFAVCAVTS